VISDDRDNESEPQAGLPTRRDVLRLLAAAPLAHFAIAYADVERAAAHASDMLEQASERGRQFRPKFFTADEYRLVRTLADIVIPRDARSGSATDAGVPAFMDFILSAYPSMQTPMRDGLRWMNEASTRRFERPFLEVTAAQRRELLDAIAYPKRAAAADQAGVEFFNRFRDLTASGFWSSRIGVADLRYRGNTAVAQWTGCPPAVLRKVGVRPRR
jgi:hypothetical protein